MASSSSSTRVMVREEASSVCVCPCGYVSACLSPRALAYTSSSDHAEEEGGNLGGGEEEEQMLGQQQGGEGEGPDAMVRPYFEVPWYRTHHLQQNPKQQLQQKQVSGSAWCVWMSGRRH